MQLLNWKMLSHPMNWITFLLMVVIAGAGLHLLLSYLGHEPARAGIPVNAMPAGQSPGEPAAGAITPQGSLQI